MDSHPLAEPAMKTALWLRIAAIISLLFAVGHTLGGRRSWSFTGEAEVLHAMRTFRVQAFGVSRTYMDFYRGFGYSLSVAMLLQSVLLWQLAALAVQNPSQTRPMILSFVLASITGGIVAWTLIFPVPALIGSAVTMCLIAALSASGR
jgi:hypothetical protein